MAYVYPNFKTKKEVREAIAGGVTITCMENTPMGQSKVYDGSVDAEGPHYPQPHRWYGVVTVESGRVVKIK